jgi:glyoxylase-like metal-dependent hydrolase (beta-lactamase superfamily II)
MKKFLHIVILICTAHCIVAQSFESKHFTIQKLANGVYAAIHKNGGYAISNAGIIDLGDATLIFDSFISPEAAEDLKKAAQQLTGHPVRYVVNSHFHDDHIQGNQVFEGADIISTERTRELIAANEPEAIESDKNGVAQALQKWESKKPDATDVHAMEEKKMWVGYYESIEKALPTLKMVLPNITFSDSMMIHGSQRRVQLLCYGEAHTESDLFLYLPADHIAFLGDILFINNQPWLGDGDPIKWMHYLDRISKMDAKVLVPGHGPVGDTSSIGVLEQYMQTVIHIAQSYIEKGMSPDKDASLKVPAPYENWLLSDFFVPNVIFVYDEMKKK